MRSEAKALYEKTAKAKGKSPQVMNGPAADSLAADLGNKAALEARGGRYLSPPVCWWIATG